MTSISARALAMMRHKDSGTIRANALTSGARNAVTTGVHKFPVLSKAGRKRKSTKRRTKCGKLEQDKTPLPQIIALNQPHRKSVPASLRHDAKAESHLGRYNLNQNITDEEYAAGVWYAGVVTRYRAVLDSPKPSPNSISGALAATGGRSGVILDDDEAERRTSVYNNAFEAVSKQGNWAARAVARVAVYGEICPMGKFSDLRRGLIALAVHRGMLKAEQAIDLSSQIRQFPK